MNNKKIIFYVLNRFQLTSNYQRLVKFWKISNLNRNIFVFSMSIVEEKRYVLFQKFVDFSFKFGQSTNSFDSLLLDARDRKYTGFLAPSPTSGQVTNYMQTRMPQGHLNGTRVKSLLIQ